MIEPLLQRFAEICYETIKMSGMKTKDIDFVELIGDATRTPAILSVTKMCF